MKNSLFYFLLLFVVIANAQKNEFKNQDEQENALAEQFFEKKYVKQSFEKFQGKITVIDKTNITFNNKTLQFWDIKPELLQMFTEGIFYPQILLGKEENNIIKSESELLSERESALYNFKRNDKLRVSNFEELVSLSKSPKVKRFRFLNYSFAPMNPQVYFIELTNENATENTDLNSFIKGAKLTFVCLGWLTT
ncbi:hypothetical protein [Flavobacterium hydrophilum]|uniref:Uncharacterized protein n=1 Tax=Flavobacterium hydrophilum TaxID=2211445 RepID=A0A2V4C130_9FLAO|nr:hypothetical protein [Flavobacterium hydrophilum]PXY44582.1 hypothetical protein DMB68_14045 [Flavobacterium hydrophilum]